MFYVTADEIELKGKKQIPIAEIATLAIKGAGIAASKLAEGLGKLKNLEKLENKLVGTSKALEQINSDRKDERMEQVISNRTNYALPFMEAIEHIKKIYNTEFTVIVGDDSIYIDEKIA